MPLLLALSAVLSFNAIAWSYLDGYRLDLGALDGLPMPREAYFFLMWCFFGTVAGTSATLAVARALWLPGAADRWLGRVDRVSDRAWIALTALAAFIVPVLIRTWALRDGPVAMDESSYQLQAELLASGRLYAPSPPMKLFFDRPILVNDGRIYAAYFVGWPALMVPGVWLGKPGYCAALYSGLTVPPLFFMLRRLAGSRSARAVSALYAASPMVAISAATQMSNTSCVFALAWGTWLSMRSLEPDRPAWASAGAALALSLAFFIRPLSALGIGVPFGAYWLWRVCTEPRGRWRSLLAFALVAAVMGALFLTVNKLQTGDWLLSATLREHGYAKENGLRFSMYRPEMESGMPFALGRTWVPSLAMFAGVILNLNFNLFGWPFSLIFTPAAEGTWARLAWASFGFFALAHSAIVNPGYELFGYHHYFELIWPLFLLTGLGFTRAQTWGPDGGRWRAVPAAALVSLTLLSLWCYAPVRLLATADIGEATTRPRDAAAAAGIHDAVVFTRVPFLNPACRGVSPTHGMMYRPNNDPDLENDVLWVNHVTLSEDARLMGHFPGRRGYLMVEEPPTCVLRFVPIESLAPGSVPDAELAKPRGPIGAP